MELREYGKYTLLNHMGKGGVASVYRANDNEAGTVLAIKIFTPSERRSLNTVRKLRDREVRMLISIQHPNVVKYYESGDLEDSYYYTMEFVEKTLLKHMRSQNNTSLPDKIYILRQVCNALRAIHHQGIVHRDIKPANILLDQAPNGAFHVKVTDLGIAKRVSEIKNSQKKKSQRAPGTPKYLSPEQILLTPVDGRSDIFSLGLVAYELLAEQPPFSAKKPDEYLKVNLNEKAEPIHQVNPEIPAYISPVVEKMLKKDREERYDSDTLARDMELLYQHLISDAKLVEKKNSDSVFYVPEVSDTPGSEYENKSVKSSWFAWPQVVAIVLIASVASAYTLLSMPDMPTFHASPAPPRIPPETHLSSLTALQEAEEALNNEAPWEAQVLLDQVNPDDLDRRQTDEWLDLIQQTQSLLAQPFLEKIDELIDEKDVGAAKTMLEKVHSSFPKAANTEVYVHKIESLGDKIEAEKEWENKISEIHDLRDEQEWTKAVRLLNQLEEYVEGKTDRYEVLITLSASVLDSWQGSLLNSDEVSSSEISHCISVVESYLDRDFPSDAIQDKRPELILEAGEYFQDAEDYETALEWYRQVVEEFPQTDASRQANEYIAELAKKGEFLPTDVDVFSSYLSEYHFSGHMWAKNVPYSGKQKTRQDVLLLSIDNAQDTEVNQRRLIRPLNPYIGFDLSFDFRFKSDNIPNNRVGVKLEDQMGNSFELFFNGQSYQDRRNYYWSGRTMSGSSTLLPAFSDEEQTWHEMKLVYHFDISRLSLFINGERLREYSLEFESLFITLFIEAEEGNTCEAAFRNIRISEP